MLRTPGTRHHKSGRTVTVLSDLVGPFPLDELAPLEAFRQPVREQARQAPAGRPGTTSTYGRHNVNAALEPSWTPYKDARIRTALAFRYADGRRVWDPDDDRRIWRTKVAPALASLDWGEKAVAIMVWWSRLATKPEYQPGGNNFATDEDCQRIIEVYQVHNSTGKTITAATIAKKAFEAGWNGRPNSLILTEVTALYGRVS